MIYEMRTYNVKPGLLNTYLKLFNDVGMPERKPHNNLIGFWFTEFGELNQVVHIWRYTSLDQRASLRAELMQNPRWAQDFLPVAMPMLDRMSSVILNPAAFSPLQ
jgi:NIPSNAP